MFVCVIFIVKMTAFIQLCQEGEVDQVRQAIALNPICIYETDADGCGSLHWAAFYNNVTLLSLLLNAALKTSTTTVTDWLNRHGGQQQATALHWAVRYSLSLNIQVKISEAAMYRQCRC